MNRATANWLFYTPLVIIYVLFVRTGFTWGSGPLDAAVDMLGFILALVGVTIRIISREWKPVHKPKGLVTSGPYSVVRNPMYIGSFLIGLGFCVIIGNLPFLAFYTVSYIVIHALVVKQEERYLAEQFPEEYAEYRATVHAWIPSPRALIRELGNKKGFIYSWRRATARELDPLCGALAGSFALEAREDYLVQGWSVAQMEITVCLALTALVIAARIICSIGPVRKYLVSH